MSIVREGIYRLAMGQERGNSQDERERRRESEKREQKKGSGEGEAHRVNLRVVP
jgi:hypothetical protein